VCSSDLGRFGPQGAVGGADGAPNTIVLHRGDGDYKPPHLSKDQGLPLAAGESIAVQTPGGGGYGDPKARDPDLVARDVRLGYVSRKAAAQDYGVAISADGTIDAQRTEELRTPAAP